MAKVLLPFTEQEFAMASKAYVMGFETIDIPSDLEDAYNLVVDCLDYMELVDSQQAQLNEWLKKYPFNY